MKRVTISIDDETYRVASERALREGRSISVVVQRLLQQFGSGESEFDRLHRQEIAARERIKGFSGSDRLSRDAVHERDA